MRGVISGLAVEPMKQKYKVSITLPLEDWEVFLNQVKKMEGNSSYPSWHIIEGIEDCIRHSKEHFVKEIEIE